jgi:hypothetical protein
MLKRLTKVRTRNILAIGAVAIVAGMVLVPNGALAKALKYTGIEGTSQNKADVTGAGQLLTSEASPSDAFSYSFQETPSSCGSLCYEEFNKYLPTPPANTFFIMTELQLDAFNVPSPGAGDYVIVASLNPVEEELADVNPPSVGDTVIPFSSGMPLQSNANGYQQLFIDVSGISVTVTASGYFAPCSEEESMCPN